MNYNNIVKFINTYKDKKAFYKTISALLINISAAFFAAVFIVPNFGFSPDLDNILILTGDVLSGIFSFAMSYMFERKAI